MKSKEEIKREIFELAQKISKASSEKFLIETTRDLYEKSILLKHAKGEDIPVIGKEEIEGVAAETPVKIEEVISRPATIDLFSAEVSATSPPSPPPAENPAPAPKEVKKPKKQTEESMIEKLQHKRIADLKAAIGINEKFQFINELFEGNMKEYNVAVDQVNNFSSFSEAESYLANLKDMYKWDVENPVATQFTELVERKFL